MVRGNTFLVLNFRLYVVDSIGRFNLESDGFAGQGLDKYLHTPAETEDEMKCGLLLNITTRGVSKEIRLAYRHDLLVRKSAPVFELLAGEDQPLLVRGNTLLVLYLRLYVINSIGRLDFESDSLARQGLDKNLHATAETQDFGRC